MTKRLLVSMAHPDDESFGFGGIIARYVDEGVEVYLICATDGGAGVIPPEMLAGRNSVAEVRLAELDCAAEYLRLRQVFKLGYKDSDMMGQPANQDPDCLWYAWQNKPEEVVQRIVEVIRAVKPQVIVTFDKFGGYGHPDHIAVHRATMEAFSKAGDANCVTEGSSPFVPQKLYLSRFPTLMLRINIWLMRLKRQNPRQLGRKQDIDLVAMLDNTEPRHARVNIRKYLAAWDGASACHVSQGGGQRERLFSRLLSRLLFTKQDFTRVYPRPARSRVDENDLFAGVILEGNTADSAS